ncbi:MAG TPA: VOC family protein [Kofleriaceae bacterium]|nr:VOC family protein [Kofleriaceae bacterium]
MQHVRGIGGVFFKAEDPKALAAWYEKVLGIPLEKWGGAVFRWKDRAVPGAGTVWSPFKADTSYFAPSDKPYMFNFVVEDLDAMLAQVREAGATVVGDVVSEDNGKFAWIVDPEGNKLELWEPREK